MDGLSSVIRDYLSVHLRWFINSFFIMVKIYKTKWFILSLMKDEVRDSGRNGNMVLIFFCNVLSFWWLAVESLYIYGFRSSLIIVQFRLLRIFLNIWYWCIINKVHTFRTSCKFLVNDIRSCIVRFLLFSVLG